MTKDFKKLIREARDANDWAQAETLLDEVLVLADLDIENDSLELSQITAAALAAKRRNALDRGEAGRKI